eukprot:m51a1_g9700 hypothetical protein (1071) ;mRNA; r:1380413-1385415
MLSRKVVVQKVAEGPPTAQGQQQLDAKDMPPPCEPCAVPDAPEWSRVQGPLEELARDALASEEAFVAKLNELGDVSTLANGWEVVFKGVEALRRAAEAALRQLRQQTSAEAPLGVRPQWLALVWGAQYQSALLPFIVNNKGALERCQMFAVTLKDKRPPRPYELIEDTFWMAMSRVRFLHEMARAQRDLVLSNAALVNAARYTAALARKHLPQAIAPCCELSVVPDMAFLRTLRQSIKFLGKLADEAQNHEDLYTALLMFRSLYVPSGCKCPAPLTRRTVAALTCSLYVPGDMGLCPRLPVVIYVFNDGMAVTFKKRSKDGRPCTYLLGWYDFVYLQLSDTFGATAAPTIHIGAKVMKGPDELAMLPPGWEEHPDKRDKKQMVYLFKPPGLPQETDKEKEKQREKDKDKGDRVEKVKKQPILEQPMHLVCDRDTKREDIFKAIRKYLITKAPSPVADAELRGRSKSEARAEASRAEAEAKAEGEGEAAADKELAPGLDLGRTPYCMLGVPLDMLLQYENSCLYPSRIPLLVQRTIRYILVNGLAEEGLLRVAGEKKKLDDLRRMAQTGLLLQHVPEGLAAVHDIAGLLKVFLRELPTPLLTPESLHLFTRAANTRDSGTQLACFASAFSKLPQSHRDLLRELFKFLACIACNEAFNSMSPKGLAIVMVPNLVGPSMGGDTPAHMECVATMITRYAELFEGLVPACARDPDDVCWFSFRRKMLLREPVLSMATVGDAVWTLDASGRVRVWDAGRCAERTSFDAGGPGIMCVVGPNVWITTSTGVRLWSAESCAPAFEIEGNYNITAMAYVPASDEVWCTDCTDQHESVLVFDSRDGAFRLEFALEKMSKCRAQLVYSPVPVPAQAPMSTTTGAVPKLSAPSKGQVWAGLHLVDHPVTSGWLLDYTRRFQLPTVAKAITALAASERFIWVGYSDGTVLVWDPVIPTIHRQFAHLHSGPVTAIVAVGNQVWTASTVIKLWDVETACFIGDIQQYFAQPITQMTSVSDNEGCTYVWCSCAPASSKDTAPPSLYVFNVQPHPMMIGEATAVSLMRSPSFVEVPDPAAASASSPQQ